MNFCYNGGNCKVKNNQTMCTCISKRFTGDRCQFDICTKNETKTCAKNCLLDSNCSCKCGKECDQAYCNGENGACVENLGKLSCVY